MTVTNTEIVTKKTMIDAGYLVVKQHASTRVLTLVDGIVYKTQVLAQVALEASAAGAVGTTLYLILRVDPMAGITATVT